MNENNLHKKSWQIYIYLRAILIQKIVTSTVFHEANAYGSKSDNGTWSGMVALVSSGVADIGVGDFTVTKERSEVVTYTDTIGYER